MVENQNSVFYSQKIKIILEWYKTQLLFQKNIDSIKFLKTLNSEDKSKDDTENKELNWSIQFVANFADEKIIKIISILKYRNYSIVKTNDINSKAMAHIWKR